MKRTELSRRPSRRKLDFDREYAALLPGVLAEGCQFSEFVLPSASVSLGVVNPGDWQCHGRLIGHHRKGRVARDANDFVTCLCDFHHKFTHSHPEWAREVGLMISRTA